MRRIGIPVLAFAAGTAFMAGIYLGVLSWLQGWDYAASQFGRDSSFLLPIILAFGIQSALYAVIRFRLYAPETKSAASAAVVGANGGTSATAMVACCLHHATNVLPVLGLSAATAFLARYQREFLQLSLAMNLLGILIMLISLQRARKGQSLAMEPS